MLYLRLTNMSSPSIRKRMEEFMDSWVEQVKISEMAVKLSESKREPKKIRFR